VHALRFSGKARQIGTHLFRRAVEANSWESLIDHPFLVQNALLVNGFYQPQDKFLA
jgi:hypothetical protein